MKKTFMGISTPRRARRGVEAKGKRGVRDVHRRDSTAACGDFVQRNPHGSAGIGCALTVRYPGPAGSRPGTRKEDGAMYRHILVPVDGSNPSQRALREAIRLGQCQQASEVVLLHIVDTVSYIPQTEQSAAAYFKEAHAQAQRYGQQLLEQAREEVERAGLTAVTRLIELKRASDLIHETIVREAGAASTELIVMGTHGRRGLSHLLLGSVAEGVMRLASCPVLLVRNA
jgi:nucleotide-binding universal stress UspA family protein